MKKIAILTVSDSRTLDSDTSGKLIAMKMANAGLSVVDRVIVNDDIVNIQTAYLQLEQQTLDIIITNGGTGIFPRIVPFMVGQMVHENGYWYLSSRKSLCGVLRIFSIVAHNASPAALSESLTSFR